MKAPQKDQQNGKHGLRRELKLRDLVLMQVIIMVNLNVCGFVAKQGSRQTPLWIIAILLFYLPLAAVVMKLSRAMPMEGGVYRWVQEELSPFAGYMAGWSMAVYGISVFASAGAILANGLAYSFGPRFSWMADSKPLAIALTALVCLLAYALNVRGLHIAKWFTGTGTLLVMATFLIMLFLLAAHSASSPPGESVFSLAWPSFSTFTFNIFTKIAIIALSGFEQCAIFSEECRKPENDVARSVMIAGPLVAAMYILGTSAILAYTDAAHVDLAAPVAQLLQVGLGGIHWGGTIVAVAVGAFNLSLLAAVVITIGMIARLPMVAGWDGVLPAWWSSLHPGFQTPAKAIGVVSLLVLFLGVLSQAGAGNEEAAQVAVGVSVGSYCLTYMLMFAVVLFGRRSAGQRSGTPIRLAALAAFSVAFMALIFSAVPLGEVTSRSLFAAKVGITICVANGFGVYLYFLGKRRRTK